MTMMVLYDLPYLPPCEKEIVMVHERGNPMEHPKNVWPTMLLLLLLLLMGPTMG